MTRRERLEAKVEKRRKWAQKAGKRSDAAYAQSSNIVSGIPLGQPILVGHHSEGRARRDMERSNNAMSRSCAESKLAKHHESKADGLESMLNSAVFSDDDNAVEALEARIEHNEKIRDRMKSINALYKKGNVAGLAEIGVDYNQIKVNLATAGPYWGSAPHLPFELTNLGARIRTDKERLKTVKDQQERTEAARSSESGIAIEYYPNGYSKITFSEKPDRSVIDELKAAGFWWNKGGWAGKTVSMPEDIMALA